jgi:uncharacterized membrane protein
MNGWVLGGTTFLASAVEMVEAATIVLAVGITQGWRTALAGAAWALLALGVIVAILGPVLARQGAITWLELIVGPFMILFGMAWLRKAIWRAAGRKAMHDEQAIFDREVVTLQAARDTRVGFATSFQGVFVEGLEVAVIVVTFAATRPLLLGWSIGGAIVAAVVVALAAVVLRAPFARVPENAIKAVVGLMLLSLGTLWAGEGLGLTWWAGDATVFWLILIYAAGATGLTLAQRRSVGA